MCLKGYTRVEGGNKGGHLGNFTITMATRSLPNDEHKALFPPKAYFYNCMERQFLY